MIPSEFKHLKKELITPKNIGDKHVILGFDGVQTRMELSVKISGPAVLQAAGNAGPLQEGSFTDDTFQLFRGRGMVIVRSTGEPGTIHVEVRSEGLVPGSVSIKAN